MSHSESLPRPERKLGAQRLAQYVSRRRCERYLHFALFPSSADQFLERYRVAREPLSPLLSAAGRSFERDQVTHLRNVTRVVDLENRSPADLVAEIAAQPAGCTFYDQPELSGALGPWECGGRADLIKVEKRPDGAVDVTIVDIKASRRESVEYRLQVAFYARLFRDLVAAAGISVESFRGAIATRDTDFATAEFDTFDLALYEREIDRLVADDDSDVARVVGRSFDQLEYHLTPACDGCPFNAICFVESAERDDLSIVPSISQPEKLALRAAGVASARHLASVLEFGDNGMTAAAGREEEAARLASRWPLSSRLPELVQRARAAVRRYDPEFESRPFLYGAGFGSLPDAERYPTLVRIFVDAQRDYLEDRIYLLSALVRGPAGSETIVEMAEAPPDTESERALMVAWIRRLLPAIALTSAESKAPLHLYLFDRRGQRFLLDAMTRHFDALCAIPAFYDLVTSSPAITQGMVSFLADEVRSRKNHWDICQNLYQMARARGFDWSTPEVEANRVFRERIFDNQRPFNRNPDTGRFVVPETTGDHTRWVESAARFGVEIPLEYVYAAWGLLEDGADLEDSTRGRVGHFAGATRESLVAFAKLRCQALAHIEDRFEQKNRQVDKVPLDLASLDRVEVEPGEIPFHRSLEDFLRLEHHAARQDALLHLSNPPTLRAQTGRSAIVRCLGCAKLGRGEAVATFHFVDTSGADSPLRSADSTKLREGSWIVLNPVVDEKGATRSAWSLVHGRIGTIVESGPRTVRIRLLSMSFRDSSFRYWHELGDPDEDGLYTIDEMVDDLNGDKFLEACRSAPHNVLYRWIVNPEEGRQLRAIRPKRLRDGRRVAELAGEGQAPYGLTRAQARIIGDRFADRVVVVQGPPGTGKSHTLGFAVLARALALATPVRPFRIAIVAKTHAATMVALESIVRRTEQLRVAHPDEALLAPLASQVVVKVQNDLKDALPEGIVPILARGNEDRRAVDQWRELAEAPLLVVGATPGGIYNLAKHGPFRSRQIDWTEKFFDLVVVDEASQMGIAEALAAAAFLRDDGQFLAIGDHRQMPPILAHAWDRESRRDLQRARPHLSIFDLLRELGFAREALDESFRVPVEVADFLNRHVYAEDGIHYISHQKARLQTNSQLDGWVAAALAPEHGIVVVEHDESSSQQANDYEAELAGELVRAAVDRLGLDTNEGVGIVVPHSAQRARLRELFPEIAESIDTVERFQGGERDLIVVSATVSNREYAHLESSFLLEPRRLTVAISRPKRKLVVIASRTVFDLIPSDLDEYERGALWKHLRRECEGHTLWEGRIGDHQVRVRSVVPTEA